MSLHMKIKLHEKLRAFVPFKRGSHSISFQAHGIFPTIYYHAKYKLSSTKQRANEFYAYSVSSEMFVQIYL